MSDAPKLELDMNTQHYLKQLATDIGGIKATLSKLVSGPTNQAGQPLQGADGLLKLMTRLVAAVETIAKEQKELGYERRANKESADRESAARVEDAFKK